MIVRVEVDVPESPWRITVPEFPHVNREELFKEWVWKHGKEQILSKLTFTTQMEEDKDSRNCSARTNEQKKTTATETIQTQQQNQSSLQKRLDLVEKLQTVEEDFLERISRYQDDDDEEKDPEDPANPTNMAVRETLDSVLAWSGTDYGFISTVEQKEVTRNAENMHDVSELDLSDAYNSNQNTYLKIASKLAAVNVPFYNFDAEEFAEEESESESDCEDDDDSDDSDALTKPPQRPPQPITTYGPVYYKSIRGSLTLMMDQLRFEPANPLDMLHEAEDEDASEEDDANTASHEYNYMEVYWNRVEKYQLTPKSSTRKHLFKLVFRKNGSKRTNEVILKMKNRVELERIAEDVRARVVLPSKKSKNRTDNNKPRQKQRRKRHKQKETDSNASPSSVMTPRERAVMLPPSLPKRMTSERSLGYNPSNHGDSPYDNISPAPRRPTRRPTGDPSVTMIRNADEDVRDDVDDDDDYDESSDDDESEDDYDESMGLWAVQDLLEQCQHLKRPLTMRNRIRERKPRLAATQYHLDDLNNKDTSKTMALLPKAWDNLVMIPLIDLHNNRLKAVMVIAATDMSEETPTIDFASKRCQEWWVPAVTTFLKDLFYHRTCQEQLSKSCKATRKLQENLKDSLRKHSDMIHGILPPAAIAKLKLQPQQWKSPLQEVYHSPPKPSVVPVATGAISIDDSSISGSIHSRYGLMVGGGQQSLDSNSTLQTNQYTAESANGLYSVSEGNDHNLPERSSSTKTAQHGKRPVPQRTNSVGNINAVIRGLQRQGSVTNKKAGTTRPIFSRMDSKRGMMMMRGSSARGAGLMRMDSFKRGNLPKMDSARFLPRLNSLRSLHGGLSASTSLGASTVDTFDQSWRTMCTDDESIHPDDLSKDRSATQELSVLTQDVAYLTNENSVRYINSAIIGSTKDVQALYAGQKRASIVAISIANFYDIAGKLDVGATMDMLAKLLFAVDRLCQKHRLIKAAVFGSSILVMSGLFDASGEDDDDKNKSEDRAENERSSAIAALEMAKEVVSEAQTIEMATASGSKESNSTITNKRNEVAVKVGIHLGEVKYGVLGQNVPQLNCFGDEIMVALRMEQTAPENCIRVSKNFRDLVGRAEDGWEQLEKIACRGALSEAESMWTATSQMFDTTKQNGTYDNQSHILVDSYVLDPPPPVISDEVGVSSVSSSFPSLATFGASDFLQTSDILQTSDFLQTSEQGGLLGVQFEESFVSGEFDVD